MYYILYIYYYILYIYYYILYIIYIIYIYIYYIYIIYIYIIYYYILYYIILYIILLYLYLYKYNNIYLIFINNIYSNTLIYIHNSNTLDLHTNASGALGYVGIYGNKRFQGKWKSHQLLDQPEVGIASQQLYAFVVACQICIFVQSVSPGNIYHLLTGPEGIHHFITY